MSEQVDAVDSCSFPGKDFSFSVRQLLLMMLSIGVVQVACYYVLGATVRLDGGFAIPQTDTLLYCQAARRIVEGAPFSFSVGTAASTGTTGVLYPFVLAIPYALGFTGDSLIRAGFWLNALFYLVFLYGWAVVVNAKVKDGFARLTAAVLVALFGQTAYCTFAQSDIGLLLAWSSLFAAGLAVGSRWMYGTTLVLFPWVRPEGDVCVIAFAMVLICRMLLGRETRREIVPDVAVASLAAMSAVGVFVFNWWLTGMMGFSSLAHRGHFSTMDFFPAVLSTATDFMKMTKELFLGIPNGSPRDFYFLPVVGTAALWCGVFLRDWRKTSDWREWVWLLAVFGGLVTVAQSGWQNTNVDRYLAWFLPTILVFSAGGVSLVSRHERFSAIARAAGCMMMLFGAGMAFVHMAIFQIITRDADMLREFAVKCEDVLPMEASIGAWGNCGFAYEMSPRRVRHVCGIYSMEYLTHGVPLFTFDAIKNEKDKRFDYWFYKADQAKDFGIDLSSAFGDAVLVGPGGYSLLKADWSPFDASVQVPGLSLTKGKTLAARVDVGYEPDEIASNYKAEMRYNVNAYPPFVLYDDLGGKKAAEVARLIAGADSMDVSLEPGKDVVVVMRTYPKRSVAVRDATVDYTFSNPLELNVALDGELASNAVIKYSEKGFSDVAFTIPGAAVKSARPRISFLGDHIACCYWFFQ